MRDLKISRFKPRLPVMPPEKAFKSKKDYQRDNKQPIEHYAKEFAQQLQDEVSTDESNRRAD